MYERGTRPRPARTASASPGSRGRGIAASRGGRRWLVLPLALLALRCGVDDEEGPRFAGITYEGRCGPHAALDLWRPGAVSPVAVGLEGLRCRVVQGELPAGMRLDADTCGISGTPLGVESREVVIRATARNAAGTVDRACALDVLGPPLGWGDALGPSVRHLPGDAFSEPAASARPARWTPAEGESLVYEIVAGTLPPGLSLDPATGHVSGTLAWPAGSHVERWWPFTVRYTASGPLGTVQGEAGAGVLVRLPALDYGPARVAAVGTPLATGRPSISPPLPGAATLAFALDAWSPRVEARLPAGLRLDPATGEISGTPAAPDEAWTGVTLTVTRGGVAFPLHAAVELRVVP